MSIILMILIGLVGVIVGTKIYLWVQISLLVIFVLYMNSSTVSKMEIGALIPFAIGMVFFIGVLVGDISYAIQTDLLNDINLTNPFIASKT